MEAVK